MKHALVLPGGPKVPDLAKAARLGITRFYWSAEDNQIDTSLFDAMRAKGYEVGLMRDPHWDNRSPQSLAEKLHDDIIRLGSHAKQCAVMADIEYHDPSYVRDFITFWRGLRPTRPTSWTLEPNQGGWFPKYLVDKVNADPNLVVIPQNYYFNMSPAVEWKTALDIAARGVRTDRISIFYGANALPAAWDGVVFDFIAAT